MKRFLEYLEDVKKRERRLLKEALPVNAHQFATESIDLKDGRSVRRLSEAEYLDWNENEVRKDGTFGRMSLYGRITYAQVANAISGFANKPEAGDRISFSVVGFSKAPPPPRIGSLSMENGGSALIAVYRYGRFAEACVASVSFNEALSFFLASGCDRINPLMLYQLLECRRPLAEEEGGVKITVSPLPKPRTFADSMNYSREKVLRLVTDPNSHFSRNAARKKKYGDEIIAAKGEVGTPLVLLPATSSAKRRYDNLLTDQNWMIALDPATGDAFDLMKCTTRTVVLTYSSPGSIIPDSSPDLGKFHKTIPRKRLFDAAYDETHGRIV